MVQHMSSVAPLGDDGPRFRDPDQQKPKKRKQLPRRSKNKIAKDIEYQEVRTERMRHAQGRCEMPGEHADGCNGFATECHHVLPRSLGGGHVFDNLLMLSLFCHDWIDDNPEAARDRGVLKGNR